MYPPSGSKMRAFVVLGILALSKARRIKATTIDGGAPVAGSDEDNGLSWTSAQIQESKAQGLAALLLTMTRAHAFHIGLHDHSPIALRPTLIAQYKPSQPSRARSVQLSKISTGARENEAGGRSPDSTSKDLTQAARAKAFVDRALQSDELKKEVQCTFALIKNIIGFGVLTIPHAISRLSDSGLSSSEALSLGIVLLLGSAVLNAWAYMLVGEACAATKQGSYVGAWKESMGPSVAYLPALTSLFLCSTCAVGEASVLGDYGTDLLAAILGVDYDTLPRETVLATISAVAVLPLCLLPSLAPLGTASVFGVLGIIATAGVMVSRQLDGSYSVGGALLASAPVAPTFHAATSGAPLLPDSLAVVFLVSCISNAYVAHYNAPAIYNELAASRESFSGSESPCGVGVNRLRSPSAAEKVNAVFEGLVGRIPVPRYLYLEEVQPRTSAPSLPQFQSDESDDALSRFRRVTIVGYGLSALLYVIMTITSFQTFGDASALNILNSYATDDALAVIARAGVLVSVTCGFALVERPFRLTTLELLGNPEILVGPLGAIISVALLVGIALGGATLDFVSALAGGTGGAFLIYVAPALMTLKLREANQREGKTTFDAETLSLWALAAVGTALGVGETLDVISKL